MIRYGPRRGLFVKPPPGAARIDWTKPLTRGLVRLWLLHEGAGGVHDLVSPVPAVAVGVTAVWTRGSLGPAVAYAGDPGSTALTIPAFGTGDFSCAVGIDRATTSSEVVAGTTYTAGFYLDCGLNVAGAFTFDVGGVNLTATGVTITDGKPHQLVGVRPAGLQQAYADGGLRNSTSTTTVNCTETALALGSYIASYGFLGTVDYCALWDRALTAGEVAALYVDPLGSLLWTPRVRLPTGTGTVDVQYLRPASDVATGTWTPVPASPTTFYTKLDEATADDADYAYSATYPASDVLTVTLSSATDPTSSSGHVVRYRYRNNTGGGQGTLLVELLQGASTVIASWTHTGITSSSWVQANQTLTGTQADNITDYSTLRLRFTASVG